MNTSIVKSLALFDLDGTLFDTNEVNYRAYQKALAHFDFKFERDFWYSNCIGRHYKDFLADMGITDAKILKDIHQLKKDCYRNYLPYAKENHHLFELIALMKPYYHVALVTTASKANVEDILRTFNRTETFDKIFTQEDVSKVKPDPECYLKAMDYFKVEPANTIIFEDSEVGLLAAERSGAFYYKVFKFNARS